MFFQFHLYTFLINHCFLCNTVYESDNDHIHHSIPAYYFLSLFNVLGINLINTITLYDSEILDQNILEKKISETINEVVNSRYQ